MIREMSGWKLLQAIFSTFIVIAVALLVYFSPPIFSRIIDPLENDIYDLRLRYTYKQLDKDVPIVIVDVDDASLKAVGRWPWPRDRLATLTQNLFSKGANVIAFDFTFPEAELNIVQEIRSKMEQEHSSPQTIQELQKIEPLFNTDQKFANSLASGNCLLGYVLKEENIQNGSIPLPSLQLSRELAQRIGIPDMQGYLGNISILQTAAKHGGFLNASPDADGICRYAPLLFRMQQDVYSSLSLEAVQIYLLATSMQLATAEYNNIPVLEEIELDKTKIPTNAWGQLLIPFRGPPYSFPYISAIDALNGTIEESDVANKLVFIGSTATAIGDLFPTAISPSFPGVEIHASVASGIIENYFLYEPTWGKGATVACVLLIGLFASIAFPFLSPTKIIIAFLVLFCALVMGNYLIWTRQGIVLPMIPPLFTLGFLFVIDLATGYFSETLKEKKIRSIFNQYLPSERIEQILKKRGKELSLEGETKEMTVLFTDIRSFTSITEKMNAKQLKQFLSVVLTKVTGVIFHNKGTIDKYVGDMVMAFWGAPLEDPLHSKNGAMAAYEIQTSLETVNKELESQNLPPVHLGIGVNTGFMTVGDMGSEYRLSYTVLGDSVNLASRLESLTKFYHVNILVGEQTEKSTKNDFIYRKLDHVRVKGKGEPRYIYELVCPMDKATPELKEMVREHEKALGMYWQKNFTEAQAAFLNLQTVDKPNSLLYQIYLDRIDKMIQSPPEKDWDGVYVFETK